MLPRSESARIVDHIDAVESYHGYATMESLAEVVECLSELEIAGLFNVSEDAVGGEQRPSAECPDRIMLPDDESLEDQWKDIYDRRRNDWKRKLSNTRVEITEAAPTNVIQPLVMTSAGGSQNSASAESQVVQIPPSDSQTLEEDVSIEEIVRTWNLNTEQARAFTVIASHSVKPKSKPLRMYLGGPGGTGKSRVIQALTDFFKRKNQSRRLRLAAFAGVAAKNIGGTTLHTALSINQNSKKSDGNKTRTELVAMWDGVNYLVIDEVSTVGCNLMVDVHNALVSATGCADLFGGISVVFAGDFAQLPPVLDTKLYAHLDHKKLRAETQLGQKKVFGKLLWRSVNTVVILTEQIRQHGETNRPFASLSEDPNYKTATNPASTYISYSSG